MPQGQVCGHCRQPDHNVRTCEAYDRYEAVVEELDETRRQLEEAQLALIDEQNINKFKTAIISQLKDAIGRLVEERDSLKALLGSVAVSSIGTGKGTSKHPDY